MHGIATMCRVLGVSPGGYYARLLRPPSARARADAELSARITEIHRRSRQTYACRGYTPSSRRKASGSGANEWRGSCARADFTASVDAGG
jgi:hypothetical protein